MARHPEHEAREQRELRRAVDATRDELEKVRIEPEFGEVQFFPGYEEAQVAALERIATALEVQALFAAAEHSNDKMIRTDWRKRAYMKAMSIT